MAGFGWLNTLYDLSIDGVFTREPHNAIESVEHTNLYEVMTFLSWKTARNEYESAVRDGVEQEQRMRSKARK